MPHALRRPRLYYERHGDGEPLLLITGFTISCAVFEPLMPLYARHFDVITYDHRGSGRSGAPPWPTSMSELADDAARLLDALGVPSVHAYGISMGGMVAQELAIRHPERVRGLILGCSTPGGPRASRPALRDLLTLAAGAAGALREPGRPWLASALFSPEFRRDHPERTRELLRHFAAHRAPPHGAFGHLLASVYHDTVSRLGLIQAPTLVLHGEHDAMAPLANARLLVDRIPDAELAIVPGAGHAFGLERPEESFTLLTDWLARRGPITAGAPRPTTWRQGEVLTRTLGLPIGALRTAGSLASVLAGAVTGRRREPETERDPATPTSGGAHVAADRRPA